MESVVGQLGSRAASMFETLAVPPQHHFKILEDGTLFAKLINQMTGEEGRVEILKVPSKSEGTHTQNTFLGVCEGTTEHEEDGDGIISTLTGVRKSEGDKPYHLICTRCIKDGKYHLTWEDVLQKAKGTRIFKMFPWYLIENKTGETVKLNTYSAGDFMCMAASLSVEIEPGSTYQDAYDCNTEEEQAVFTLPDGRSFSGINLKAGQTIELTDGMFE